MVNRFLARLAISIAALLVMLVAALIAVGYFAFALYLFMLGSLSPPLAALATGILVLLLAIFLVLVTAPFARRKRSTENEYAREARENAAEFGGELGRRVHGLAKTYKSGAFLAALVAGFAVGVSPKLREFLLDILKL